MSEFQSFHQPNRPRAYLVDSSIYIFRGYHTLPLDMRAADGVCINAVTGFADFLLELIENQRPQYLLCAFDDAPDDCWRREIFPAYKANRQPTPAELKPQFGLCRQLVAAAGISHCGSSRYEADDIIGSFSRGLKSHGIDSTIISADKDLTQLVQAGDFWWDVARNRVWGEREIYKNWGVKPAQIADLLALCGDKTDNIEGIDGIGIKTAANLLCKFGSLENLLKHVDDIALMRFRGALRCKNLLKMHAEKAILARRLTEIASDPSLDTSASQLTRQSAAWDSLKDLMQYLNFGKAKQQRWQQVLHRA